ncbi:MAG: hypothetical protein WAT34_03725 [Chitinophagaceae bacterium]|nr:hypothetical protein [Chitinophagaceae bacterium]MBK9568551.1 hypothetical protein [Chitinophagaceae bacterium]
MNIDRNNKVEEILSSLDGCPRASVPDFFYTRLKAKMLARLEDEEKRQEPASPKSWLLRPAFAFLALAVILLINTFILFREGTGKEEAMNDSETLQSIAAEYSLNDNNSVYELNQDK